MRSLFVWGALFSVLGFGFTFWGFGCVPFSSQVSNYPSIIYLTNPLDKRWNGCGPLPQLHFLQISCQRLHYWDGFLCRPTDSWLLLPHPRMLWLQSYHRKVERFAWTFQRFTHHFRIHCGPVKPRPLRHRGIDARTSSASNPRCI